MKLRGGILPKVSHFYSSIHGDIDLFQFAGKETLRAGGVTHSGGFTYEMWKKGVERIQKSEIRVQNCLLLGLGGGTVIQFLHSSFPNMKITAIDIDPKMIEIARKEFLIHANLICADAIDWIREGNALYDLIVVDLYISRFNPKKARTIQFLRLIKKKVRKGGVILYNSHFIEEKPDEFSSFHNRCESVFRTCEILQEYPLSRLLLLR